jgi:DNA-binding NarL/FixJ family response regulator
MSAVAAESRTIKVFLVEDSADLVRRLEEMLAAIEGVRTIGSAGRAEEAVRRILALRPDAVLCDIRLDLVDGAHD